MSMFFELFDLMRSRKKFFLFPLLLLFVLIGGLFVLSQGAVIAPFIYTLF